MKDMRCHRTSGHFAVTLAVVAGLAFVPTASAQTYTVLHNFGGFADGRYPMAGLTMDAGGNLYGTTRFGGNQACNAGCGTVFKLSRKNSSWIFSTLYKFTGAADGSEPLARVVFGPDGALYGTTSNGGSCCGTVFRLTPSATICGAVSCPWHLTVVHAFSGVDGFMPGAGDLAFDQSGNIYGTAAYGGPALSVCSGGCGVVFELTRSGGAWTENVLYSFTGQADGGRPIGGVIFDRSGNLLGTASLGGAYQPPDFAGAGVVFRLTPSSGGWTESVLYQFQDSSGDGGLPYASPTLGPSGEMYGTTTSGGGGGSGCNWSLYQGCGTVYQGSGQTAFGFFDTGNLAQGYLSGPMAPISIDASGNLYGTTWGDGEAGVGNIFKLTPSQGQWIYTSLHDFTDGDDGGFAASNVVIDAQGNLFGTSSAGGSTGDRCNDGVHVGCGVIWEIAH